MCSRAYLIRFALMLCRRHSRVCLLQWPTAKVTIARGIAPGRLRLSPKRRILGGLFKFLAVGCGLNEIAVGCGLNEIVVGCGLNEIAD